MEYVSTDLRNESQPGAEVVDSNRRDVDTVDYDLPLSRVDESKDTHSQRRLSAPSSSKQAYPLTSL